MLNVTTIMRQIVKNEVLCTNQTSHKTFQRLNRTNDIKKKRPSWKYTYQFQAAYMDKGIQESWYTTFVG